MNETSAEALFGILLVGDVMSLYEFLSNRQASFSFYLYCTELRSAVSGPPRPTIPQDAYDSVGAGMSRLESHLKSLETQPLRQLQHGTSDLHPIWSRRHRPVAPAAVCNVRGQMPLADWKAWKAMIEQRWTTLIECVVGVGSVEGQIRDFPIPRALVDVRD